MSRPAQAGLAGRAGRVDAGDLVDHVEGHADRLDRRGIHGDIAWPIAAAARAARPASCSTRPLPAGSLHEIWIGSVLPGFGVSRCDSDSGSPTGSPLTSTIMSPPESRPAAAGEPLADGHDRADLHRQAQLAHRPRLQASTSITCGGCFESLTRLARGRPLAALDLERDRPQRLLGQNGVSAPCRWRPSGRRPRSPCRDPAAATDDLGFRYGGELRQIFSSGIARPAQCRSCGGLPPGLRRGRQLVPVLLAVRPADQQRARPAVVEHRRLLEIVEAQELVAAGRARRSASSCEPGLDASTQAAPPGDVPPTIAGISLTPSRKATAARITAKIRFMITPAEMIAMRAGTAWPG